MFQCCRSGYTEIDEQEVALILSVSQSPSSIFSKRIFARGNVITKVDPDALCGGAEAPRNLIAYFILGLMNNFAYVVFLSAAADILPKNWPLSIMILVEMIPIIVAQGVAPLFIDRVPYFARVWFLTLTSFGSFYMVAFFDNIYIKLGGVAIASMSSGFGETTWMALSSYYHKNVVSMYSSGTGGAGIAGSLSYLLLHSIFKLTPRDTLLVVAPFALLLGVSYFFILARSKKPTWRGYRFCVNGQLLTQDAEYLGPNTALLTASGKYMDDPAAINGVEKPAEVPFGQKLRLQVRLLRYTMPLFLVYFAEYLINQGVNPVNKFPQDKFTSGNEYNYYFFLYQAGVFASRSSVNLVRVKNLWILAGGQCGLLVLFASIALFNYIPTIWIMFPIIFVEGLFGGAIYANTFYLASEEIEESLREFCMSSISFWYSFGILFAGLLGGPAQELLTKYRRQRGSTPPIAPSVHSPSQVPSPSHSPSVVAPSPVASVASPSAPMPSSTVSSPVPTPAPI